MKFARAMWLFVCFSFLFSLKCLGVVKAEECGYQLCPATKEDHINVHLIPHTHDDVGWLKNIDQYYFGDAKWYQTASVQYIIDSVIQTLTMDPNRKFTYVEMAFFERWWRVQNSAMRSIVHKLVKSGQLEFALGGWTMNDEAVVHYSDSIDQLTRGLAFLKSTFGDCGRPRVAWQIDPFGHAREQAKVFLDAGFDGVFFQRMDFREKRQRLQNREMELLWRMDNDNSTGLFTHILYQGYCSPPGFCFDSKCNDPPMIVDPYATNYNVPQRVGQFLDYVRSVAKSYATNHIFVPMGCDFTFENANENFINIDRLIDHVNANQRRVKAPAKPFNLLYSSPACYTKAVNEAFAKLGKMPSRYGDFFPYSSASNTYWTGFFTSRPTVKLLSRQGSSLLAACEQAHLLKPGVGFHPTRKGQRTSYDQPAEYLSPDDVVDRLRRIVAVMQHHDAVTGTEKQHVSDDYMMRLSGAMEGCHGLVTAVAEDFFSQSSSIRKTSTKFEACIHLNVSVCNPTTNKNFLPDVIVAVYNPLGWNDLRPWIRIPLHVNKTEADAHYAFTLTDYGTGELIPVQVTSVSSATEDLIERTFLRNKGHSELVFRPETGLVPAGYSLFALKGEYSDGFGYGYQPAPRRQRLALEIGTDGLPVYMTTEGHTITMQLLNYDAQPFSRPTSGAYVFRALSPAVPISQNVSSELIVGELMSEVRTTFSSWAHLSARLYEDDSMEVEWTVGPLPKLGQRVTEIILRYKVSGPGVRPEEEGEFFTDSMGNGLIRRVRTKRPTHISTTSAPLFWQLSSETLPLTSIEMNYYPVVNRIMLKGSDKAFAVYTDRAEGGSSLSEGQIELMLHRATVVDDGLGVGEPLMERTYSDGIAVKGVHRLLFDTVENVEGIDARMAQEVSRPPMLFFRDRAGETFQRNTSMSLLREGLPPGVHLLTAQQWPIEGDRSRKTFLVRLQHTNSPLDGPISVDLADAFTMGRVIKTTEVSLTANQLKTEAKKNKLIWPNTIRGFAGRYHGTTIILEDGEIKTLVLEME